MASFIRRGVLALLVVAAPAAALAQRSGHPDQAIEVQVGTAAFIDDALIQHAVVGGSYRVYLSPRIGIGPEITWMIGPGHDRDLFVTGNLTFDWLAPIRGRPRRVTPYLLVGGGMFQHRDRFGSHTFSSHEGAVTGGGGARISIGERWYLAPEYRLGWEPHVRVSVAAGYRWRNSAAGH